MLTVLSLTPAIDQQLLFDGFRLGSTNRVASSRECAGGKGINVALAARALGLSVRCVGLLPAMDERITERLSRNGVQIDFLPAPGRVRVNRKLLDRSTGVTTEANEPSPEAPAALLDQLAEKAVLAARDSDALVLTGSLPTGCPPGWYRDVIARVRKAKPGCRCILDADAERFRLGLAAHPWLVKPNLAELTQAAGMPLHTREDILGAARGLLHCGAEVVVVSLGAEGALAVCGQEALFAPALPVRIQTTTGAGDAMVAGLLAGFLLSDSLKEALRHGVAAASARCMADSDAFLDVGQYSRLLSDVAVEAL